jgi:predicted lipoprotein with Yx(FWY)xxD motif
MPVHTKEHTMLTNHRSRGALIASAAVLATLASALAPTSASLAAQAKGPLVSTATTSLGRILVDTHGHTLYLFEKDKSGKSACSGACATAWPPLIATAKPRAGAAAKASRLGTTKRADGRLQVTYNHHPLYTFIKDTKKGQTNGEGLNAFGAEWFALSAAGAKVEKPGAKSSATGGY